MERSAPLHTGEPIDKLAEEEQGEEEEQRQVILSTPALRARSGTRTINNLKDQFVFC
jgi:hypothetical protein